MAFVLRQYTRYFVSPIEHGALDMHIPQHITLAGDVARSAEYDDAGKAWAEREKVAAMMHVPDRIFVAGGDVHKSRKNAPQEMLIDQLINQENLGGLPDVPLHIRLDQYSTAVSPEPTVNRHDESMSQASIAIDDNPFQELKIMRRQLTKVCRRLYELEDDLDRRRNREFFFGTSLLGVAALVFFIIFKR